MTLPSERKKYLITGGAGFIGSHLTERLLKEGHSVTIIDDFSTGSVENLRALSGHASLRVIHSAVSACPILARLVEETDKIVHLAAAVGVDLIVKSPIRTIETNLRETEAILEAASRKGTPILIASTSEVYGKSQKPGFSETDDLLIGPPYLGRWSYACSKLMDEFLALAFSKERALPVIVVRLFNTVGPRQTGQYGMVLPRFISSARQGTPLRVFGTGQQTRCFCFVLDTVEALVRLMRAPNARGQIVNIGSDHEVTIEHLAQEVIRLLKSASSIEHVPYDQAYQPGFEDMLRRKPVIDKLFALTGFRPRTSLEEIILRTAQTEQPDQAAL